MSDLSLPLCVDLDDTLVLGDNFYAGLGRLIREQPQHILSLIVNFLIGGRPKAKALLAQLFPVDPEKLNYRQDLLAYLHEQKQQGRKLYLVSASNQKIVLKIAQHLKLFDGAFGSSDRTNLKGATKAAFIIDNIGEKFCYAGDSFADLLVWRKASAAILCGKARNLRPVLHLAVEAEFPRPPGAYSDSGAPQGPRAQ
jgi:phosphoserine phosphatase